MKGAISSIPSLPVIQPMRNDPTSSTMEPLSRISRMSLSSISTVCVSNLAMVQSAERITGASITAATATMYPSDHRPAEFATEVAATKATMEVDP